MDADYKLPGKHNDLIRGPTNCTSLLTNAQVWASTDLYPPPVYPPPRWRELFDEKGVIEDFIGDEHWSEFNRNTTCWKKSRFRSLVEAIKKKQDGGYEVWKCAGYGDQDFTRLIFAFFTSADVWDAPKYIKGKSWIVLGSDKPWIEIMLLAAGASKVTTIDYRVPDFMLGVHPGLEVLTPDEFVKHKHAFDGVIQYSSMEHSGLGRYGDQLNPFADRQTIQALWCLLKPDGWLLTGPTMHANHPPKDAQDMRVFFNSGRSYGPRGLSRLFKNFRNEFEVRDRGEILLLGYSRVNDIPNKPDIEITS